MTFNQGPRSALVAAVVACCALGARADEPPAWPYVPPPEQGEPIVEAHLNANHTQVELVDLANRQTIIGQIPNVYLWDDYALRQAVQPTIELHPQPTGFDLVYTFTNETAAAKPMGRLRLGSMLLGEHMTYQNFTVTGEDTTVNAGSYTAITRNYPGMWYSPVAVLRNDDYAVGVSMMYPMMEYKHDVRMAIVNNSVPDRGLAGWEAIFQLQNFGGEGVFDMVRYQHDLAPGETRTYVIAVRVNKTSSDWVRTLLPYRDFFLKFYGGVRYSRNTDPIIGFSTGTMNQISDSNPYGFGNWRPDLNGWNPFTSGLRNLQGWKNTMVWKPTGHLKNHPGANMAFNFTSQWLADPELATALDPNVGFPSVVSAGKNLGFWWGHSCSVMFGWGSSHVEALDPDNPDHVRIANAELDLAVQAGATMIGLDTFHPSHAAPWNLTKWLQMMQARHPNVRFVTEPVCFDIMHSLAPTFITGYLSGGNPQTLDDLYYLKQPHTLANFLLPGNEIWASFMYAPHEYYFHIRPTDQMVNDDIAHYARMGYTPIMFPPIDVTLQNRPDQKAAEAWNDVVPADLMASYKWNRNYVNSSIVRRADGSMAIIEASSPSGGDAPAPPPQPAPPPEHLDGGGAGGGDGGGDHMVMGSAPDPTRHAAKTSKKSKAAAGGAATAANLADATPDQITSMQRPDLSSGRVDTKVHPTPAVKQNSKLDTSAPKDRHDVMPSPSGAGGGGSGAAPMPLPTRGGAISVVPSSIPGMRRPGAPTANVPAAAVGDAGLNLNAVRQAILRAQRARPVAGASVVEVER